MRSPKFLRFSFLGVLLFSPGMADEIDKVHEEALRVLHEKTGQTATTQSPAATVSTTPATAPKSSSTMDPARAEREGRIKAEAQQRMAEREKLQEQRRQQFEQYVKERERLRQQQRALDENVAGQTKQASVDDIHAQALEALHKAQAQPAAITPAVSQPALEPASTPAPVVSPAKPAPAPSPSTSIQPAPVRTEAAVAVPTSGAARVSEAEVAPRVTASTEPVRLMAQNTDEIHRKALEALHQQTQAGSVPASQSVTTAPASSTSSGPSPELQKRLQEMQAEIDSAQPQARSASSPISDAYVKELEQRARENAQQTGSVGASTPAPLDTRSREILRRQDAEIARKAGVSAAPATTPPVRASAPSAYSKTGLSAEEEVQAREVLRQQTVVATPQPSTTTSAPVAVVQQPAVTAAPAPVAIPEATSVQYSKEMEDRAREIIRQRSQQGSVAPAPVASSAPTGVASSPVAAAPVQAPAATALTPAPTGSGTSDVHNQALETLGQIQAGEGIQTMPKTRDQRLRELTDLYRADRIGPAEYHQRRAQILAEPK